MPVRVLVDDAQAYAARADKRRAAQVLAARDARGPQRTARLETHGAALGSARSAASSRQTGSQPRTPPRSCCSSDPRPFEVVIRRWSAVASPGSSSAAISFGLPRSKRGELPTHGCPRLSASSEAQRQSCRGVVAARRPVAAVLTAMVDVWVHAIAQVRSTSSLAAHGALHAWAAQRIQQGSASVCMRCN